jgi:hypothetical protein
MNGKIEGYKVKKEADGKTHSGEVNIDGKFYGPVEIKDEKAHTIEYKKYVDGEEKKNLDDLTMFQINKSKIESASKSNSNLIVSGTHIQAFKGVTSTNGTTKTSPSATGQQESATPIIGEKTTSREGEKFRGR